MPSLSKLFSSLSSSKKHPPSPLLPSGTSTNVKYDEYHTSECNKPSKSRPIKVSIKIESPPIILFGHPSVSTGAFFSGNFTLDVLLNDCNTNHSNNKLEPMMSISKLSKKELTNDYIIVKNVSIYLVQIVKYNKPFVPNSNTLQNCNKCTKKTVELAHWDILSQNSAFAKGSSHSCPFSYIIPGSLPPTSILSTIETSISYELICKATYIDPISGNEKLINLSQPINIQRSILKEQDKTSTRIFPPTDVTATAVIPNVVNPRSMVPIEIKMVNISTAQRRWGMKKLNWRLEECVTVKSNHCPNHESKYNEVYESNKRQKKSYKINKNSGGNGYSCLNYYFEVPKRQLNNNNNSIQTPSSPDIHPLEERNDTNSTGPNVSLAPIASNWSVSVTTPISSNNSTLPSNSNNISPSLDQVLSQSITPIEPLSSTRSQTQSHLSNPNEVVLPSTHKPEMYIEEIRSIASGELKNGWKTDFSGTGRIDLIMDISLMELTTMGLNNLVPSGINSENCNSQFYDIYKNSNSGCNASIDIEDPLLGIYVTHNLILEAVVAEELINETSSSSQLRSKHNSTHVSANSTAAIVTGNIAQSRMRPAISSNPISHNSSSSSSLSERRRTSDERPQHVDNMVDSNNNSNSEGIPTGVARVLRMQFKVIMSERSGFGIAWDDDVPPIYPAVGALSPPNYAESLSNTTSPNFKDRVIHLDNNNQILNKDNELELEKLRI